MAIILVILGLLIGTTLPLLSGITKQRHIRSTQAELEEIKEALTGYAGIHWSLPSADTDGDGQGDGTNNAGTLPYVDLGLGTEDAWRNAFTYDVNFSLTTTSDKSGLCAALATVSGDPQFQQGASATPQAVIAISKGPDSALNGENGDGDRVYISQTPSDTFDDLVIVLNANQLFGKLDCSGSGGGGTSCSSFTVLNRRAPRIYIQGGVYVSCTSVSNNATFVINSGETIDIYNSSTSCNSSSGGSTITFNDAEAADSDGDCNVRWTGVQLIDE
jgi:type II secretory pathway pseudopilin PulG